MYLYVSIKPCWIKSPIKANSSDQSILFMSCFVQSKNTQINTHHAFRKQEPIKSIFTSDILLFLGLLLEVLQLPRVVCVRGQYRHPRDLRQTARGRPGERRVPTVQEELPVVDDAGTWIWRGHRGRLVQILQILCTSKQICGSGLKLLWRGLNL